MVGVKAYNVTATREGRYWLLEISGVGTTQARTLREAPDMARSLISVMTRTAESRIKVAVSPVLPPRYRTEVQAARSAIERLALQQTVTAEQSRRAARRLVHELGLSGRDAAAVLGVSPQRVSQLVAE